MALAMFSSWSVLTIIFYISKELQSSTRAQPPLCFNALMVMSTHILATVNDPFQLSLHPESSFAQSTGSQYPFLVFLWADHTDTSFVSEHKMQSPEAVSMLESSTFSLDKSESEEAWSLELLELPGRVPFSRSMVAPVGLEGGWPVPTLIIQSWSQFPVVIQPSPHCPVQSCVSSDFLGVDMGPLVAMIVEWMAGTAVSLSLCGDG